MEGRPARPGEGAEPVRIIESYGLAVGSVWAAGSARSNLAHTVTDARYTVYTNHTAALRLEFRDGPPYVYHLGLPYGRTETQAGVYRETRRVTVQAGSEFLLETYTAEICHDAGGIIQAGIFENGRIVVTLNVARKP
ncbi:MAG: hypothetical protein LBC88_05495 [Spirochaetaceae bacterium]|nr:hypothetical protein [Spirochaetaceae bacterium]